MVRSVCLVGFAIIGSTNVQAQEYALTEIGTRGGYESKALGLNDRGQVVGSDYIDSSCWPCPYIWYDGEMQQPITVNHHGRATAINNHGRPCGYSCPTCYADGRYDTALVWQGLVPIILEPFPGGDSSRALDVNDADIVVGWSETITGRHRAVLWTADGIQDLSLPFPTSSYCREEATAANNVGQIVVIVYGYSSCERSYVWQNGVAVALSEEIVGAQDINDQGTIVGELQVDAFILDHGLIYDIGKLPGDSYATAFAVNENNVVVGTSYSPIWGDRTFVWDGVMADLNDHIPEDSGWLLQEAFDINVHGQIVGYGLNPDGKTRGYLLTPLFSQPEVLMFSLFVGCLSGPYPDSPAECELFDFDDSGTIDLEDFAYFQRRYRD